MTGNSRHRRVYHNTYGDNIPNTENKDQFPNQGGDPFSNNPNTSNLAFQSQSSLQYSSGSNSSLGSSRNINLGDNTFGDKSGTNTRVFASASSVVSSPFTKNTTTHSNTTSSPFMTSTNVPAPNLSGNYPYPATRSTPNQPYGSGYNPYGTDQPNLGSSNTGFTGVPSPNLGVNVPNPNISNFSNTNTNFGNVPGTGFGGVPNINTGLNLNTSTNFSNQSQHQDRSQMYLDGQVGHSDFQNQTTQPVHNYNVNTGGFNQNTNAVFPNNNLNYNTVNLSTLNRNNNFVQTQGFQHNNLPLPGQLGAQLTKFGEIYNQRLQQSESVNEIDPPLMDELGINVVDIYNHLVSVILPKKGNETFLNYEDLYGPLLTFITFALGLMFSGKICFSIIYVLFVFCNVGIYMLFNFINDTYITFSKTVTILGYSLLPLCVTPFFGFLSRFIKVVPVVLVYLFVLWSSVSASYLFQVELNLKGRFYFIMYPILLYYSTFANIVIF